MLGCCNAVSWLAKPNITEEYIIGQTRFIRAIEFTNQKNLSQPGVPGFFTHSSLVACLEPIYRFRSRDDCKNLIRNLGPFSAHTIGYDKHMPKTKRMPLISMKWFWQ